MIDQNIKVSFKEKENPKDPVTLLINMLRYDFGARSSSLSHEDAKKVQAAFKDVVYIDDGESKFWRGGRKLHFFHIEGLEITDIETPEHYGFDEDTLYVLYSEGRDLLEDPFVDIIELKEGDLEDIKEQLKEMNRYDILLKLEIWYGD